MRSGAFRRMPLPESPRHGIQSFVLILGIGICAEQVRQAFSELSGFDRIVRSTE
jgi:hypothetical protein